MATSRISARVRSASRWRIAASLDTSAEVGGQYRGRYGPLVPPALARLLPCVREDADAPAQYEQAAGQRRREAQLGEDDRGGAVDVHRHRPPSRPVEARLQRQAGAQVFPSDQAVPYG